VRIYLGGYLRSFAAGQSQVEISLLTQTPLKDVLAGLDLPTGEVYLAVLNGRLVDPADTLVADADEVKLYPPVDGG
jgi:molybdopterin converting factor small subunit